MSTFALQLEAFAKKAGDNANEVVKKVAIDLLGRVVKRSPVGNPDLWKYPVKGYVGGRFRGNWQVTVGSPASGTLERKDTNPLGSLPGAEVASEADARLLDFKVGPSIFIVNNLPYGPRLEYEGWSTQAPAGFIRLAVAEYQSVIAKALEGIKK